MRLVARGWIAVLLVETLLVTALLVARLVALPQLSSQPRLVTSQPADGASGVPPRTALVLRFSQSMNTPSVERALRIEPRVSFQLEWDALRTTLTISPTESLAPDTLYRVTLASDALGQRFRPLGDDATAAFRTAPAPAVVAVFPANGAAAVALDAPVSIRFSRPIVRPAALTLPGALPQLRFDPPLAGTATWLDEQTVVFRPDAQLLPSTRYRATLDPALSDIVGGQLGRPFDWSFTTLAPHVLAIDPERGAQLAGPRSPLHITLSHQLALDQVRAELVLTPPISGTLSDSLLPNGTQLITFTPVANWQPGISYQAELGARNTADMVVLAEPLRWSFSAAPQPALVGRFPGEGQTLPAGRELRLVFSTPMDAVRLRDAVRFSPQVDAPRLIVSDTEARIAVDLQAATAYTVTLPADLTDRAGAPLGREYQLRFSTAPAPASLVLPQTRRHVVYTLPGPSAALLVRRTNLTQLSLELYRLDTETVVRALAFRESDWLAFQPERYGQQQVRSWTVPLTDTLNIAAEDAVSLALSDGALPAGAYYLRITTPEGLRADTLLLSSNTRLTLRQSEGTMLAWATDAASGAPLAGLPLALYQGGARVQQGLTDAAGVWQTPRVALVRANVVVATGDQPAAVAGDVPATEGVARYRLALASDRAEYRPGEQIALAGFVRRVVTDTVDLPAGLRVSATIRQQGSIVSTSPTLLNVTGDGAYGGVLTLNSRTAPGPYTLVASLDGTSYELPFTVVAGAPEPLTVRVRATENGQAMLEAATPEGLPLAGAVVSWTLRTIATPLPAASEFQFGDDTVSSSSVAPQSGNGVTGDDGRLLIPLGDTPPAFPLRYQLALRVSETGGPTTTVTSFFDGPDAVYAGIRLPKRLLTTSEPGVVEVLAADAQGRPRPGAALRLEVVRRTWETSPASSSETVLNPVDEPVRTRELLASDDGIARVDLALPPGEYRLRAAASGGPVTAAATLWSSRPGFNTWGPDRPPRAMLVADRASYRPGDTATLLLASSAVPFGDALSMSEAGAQRLQQAALVTITRPGEITGTVRTLRAGEPLTLTLGLQDAPGVRVALLTPPEANGAGATLLGETTLPVAADEERLTATLSLAPSYAPGTTATLTLTTALGATPVPASVIFSLAGASPAVWNTSLRTDQAGLATVQVRLPDQPALLQARVLAQSADRFGETGAVLQVGPPLTMRLIAPPFLRAGDQTEVAALLQSTGSVTQELTIAPEWTPPEPAGAQSGILAPEATLRFPWSVRTPQDAELGLRVRLRTTDGDQTEQRVAMRVLPPITATTVISGVLVERRLDADLSALGAGRPTDLIEVEAVPSRGALLQQALAALVAQADRGVLDEAALVHLGAPLRETQEIAVAATTRLADLQNADGGWGWWSGGSSAPFPTAAALDALATARDTAIAVPEERIARGLSALRETARDRTERSDLRAFALYVLSRYGVGDSAALATLAAEPAQLGPDGAAYLLLARAPGEARADQGTLARLEALARRETGAFWSAPSDARLLRTDVALTALAARALEHAAANASLVAEARAWLAAHRPVGGWLHAYEAALAALALAPTLPEQADGYRIRLGDDELLAGNKGDETIRMVARRGSLRTDAPSLAVSSQSALLVSVRLTQSSAAGEARQGDMALLREYLDPRTGARIDPDALVVGQLVRVRVTLVSSAAHVFVEVEEPLPAGAALVDAGAGAFDHVARRGDRLLLSTTVLTPGVAEHSYLLRATIPGRYAAPAAVARTLGGDALGHSNATAIVIAGKQ